LDFPNVARTFQNPFYEDLLRYETQYAGDAFYETMETRGAGMRDTDDTTRRFLLYCLTYLGDPQMQIWLGNPGTLALDFPGTVEIGDDTIDIAVTKNGNPAIGALVTLSKDGESYAYGITNVDGEISLPLMANTTGTFDVSATAYQSVAASGSGQVVTTTETVLSLGDIVIIDDGTANSRGNGNGLAELGETVVIDLSVINNGGLAASSVQADLSWDETTWESLVDLELASASLGGIAAGSEANEPAAFRIRIPRVLDSADAANLVGDDLMQMAFEIELTSLEVTRSHKWVLEASRPILKKYINLVDDAAGNDDGIADNGETINLYVGLWNQGMGTASALAGSLVAYPTSAATMIDNSADLEELLPGEAGAIGPFQLTLNNVTQLTLGLFIKDMTPADHPQVLNRRFHLIRPPAPDSLKSIGQRSSIVLIWQNPLAPRDPIIGARVYRSEQEAGPFEEVFPGMAMNTTYFRDDGLNALTAYYYKIAVIDSSGNEGALSEMLETNTSPGPLANWPQLLGTATRSSPTITELDGWALREILAGGEVVYCFHGDGSEFYDGDGIASTSGILTQRPGSEDAPIWGKVAAWDMDMAADNDPEIVALSFSGCPDGSDTGLSVLMSFNHKGEMIWHHCLGRYGVASPAIGLIDSDDEYEVVTATSSRIFAYNHDGTAMSGTNNGVLKDIVDARNLFQTPTLADIDNDGTDEVLLLAWNGNDRLQAQKLFALNGDGTDVAGFPVDLGTLGYSNLIGNTGSVVVADLDQNSEPGDLDLEIAFMTAKRFWIFEHDGSLRLVSSSDGALAFGNDGAGLQTPAIGDVDLDGHPEVVFALRTIYGMVLHALKGTATEVSAENELPGFPLIIDENNDFEPGSPIIANINDDIFPEILIGDTEGRVHVYDKDGNGVLGFPYNIPGADLRYGGLAVWDVDGNGYNNLVIQASDNRDLLVLDLTQSLFPSDPDERIRQNPWPMKYHDARNSGFYQADIMTPVFLSQLSAIEESPGKIRITFTTAVTGAEILIWRQEAAQGEWTLRHRLTAIDGELGHYDILDETEASGTFEYKIEIVDDSGTTFEAARFQVEATGSIRALTLEPNRPNPFRPGTMLSFQIPGTESTPVELWIYDSTGRVIRRLISGNLPPGTHQVQWNGRNDNDQPVAAGLYLVRLRAMGEEKQGKMLLLK
ncbi:MAG: hypothetical protein KJ831_09165, partial [Candidatus Eisenbacteria bacterium]|nr:hypothetical protein [Candidatus Eisenbacteria bacterium]